MATADGGTVLLVRHGETTWNVEGRIQGWAATPLSGRGREQARATGARFAELGVDRLVASDLQRARDTVGLARETDLDAPVTFERAWRERDFGEYQGLDRAAIAERRGGADPDASLVALEGVPGGESLDEFCRRVLTGWESVLVGLGDETVAVVTHGGPIRVVLADVTGRTVEDLAREWRPANCGVTAVDAADPAVTRRDDTAHLD